MHILYELMLCWRNSLFGSVLIFLCHWDGEGGKYKIALVRAMVMPVIVILGVRIPTLGECAWLAIISSHMVVVIAPAA